MRHGLNGSLDAKARRVPRMGSWFLITTGQSRVLRRTEMDDAIPIDREQTTAKAGKLYVRTRPICQHPQAHELGLPLEERIFETVIQQSTSHALSQRGVY